MTTWELECEIRTRLKNAKDRNETRFLESCLSEVLTLRSLHHRFTSWTNLFREHVISMHDVIKESPQTAEAYERIKNYLERNK